MKLFLKLTDNVIKQNLRQLVLFTFLYRLVAGIFYVKTVNGILRFSLHMAGYSYLTIGNLRAFLLHPFTIPFDVAHFINLLSKHAFCNYVSVIILILIPLVNSFCNLLRNIFAYY